MSNHLHHGTLAGLREPAAFFRRVHTSFAQHFHRRHGGLGPVIAHRPRNYEVAPSDLLKMVAYHHMNPVRAGLAKRPADSTWTSHRIYLRLEPAPRWLNVEAALSLMGFADTAGGRREFDEVVRELDLADWARSQTETDVRVEPAFTQPNGKPSQAQLAALFETCGRVCKGEAISDREVRSVFAIAARRQWRATFKCIAKELKVSDVAVYKLVNRSRTRLRANRIEGLVQRVTAELDRDRARVKRLKG